MTIIIYYLFIISAMMLLGVFIKRRNTIEEVPSEEAEPKIVIDPAKAFCQRVKFVMRLKKRMKEFKTKKESLT